MAVDLLRRCVAPALLALVVLGAAACSGDDEAPPDTTTTTVESTTTTVEPALEEGRQVDPLYYVPTVGDCFDRRQVPGADNKQVDVILRLDCQLPHQFEVYATVEFPLPEDGDTTWPGDDPLRELARARCAKPFDDYVGMPYETSQLEIGYLLPPEDNFAVNQVIGCYLFDPVPDRSAGSAQGAAR